MSQLRSCTYLLQYHESPIMHDGDGMHVHLITAESPASRHLRRARLIQFPTAHDAADRGAHAA